MKLLKSQSILIIALILLTIPTFWTLIRPGFFPMQDDLQAFRIFEMDKCFQDLQIPCRWIPDMGFGYGYPQFNFYSPSVFYLGEIFHLFGLQFIDSVKLLFVLGFVLSAVTMFIFLRPIFGKVPAFFGSLLYTYLPFKAVEVYVRGSLSEFWALVIFPLLFWSSYQLIETKKKRYGIFLTLSIALMLLTHNLLSMLILPVLAIWCLVLGWRLGVGGRSWKNILILVGFGILGLGLACFFVLPALFEKQYVHVETLLSGYFDYRQHFVQLSKLFFDNEWGYGSSNLGQTETLNLSVGIVQWILGLAGLAGGLIYYKKEKKLSIIVIFSGVMAILSLLMIHQKSSFIWSMLPFLVWLQFPWRFLALSGFFLSVLSAAAIYYLRKWPKIMVGVGVLAVVLSFGLTFNFYHPKDWYNISDKDKFTGDSWQKQLTISIFDYLPIFAKLPPNHIAPDRPEVLSGNAQFESFKKGSNFQEATVDVENGATLRFPIFDFPGMNVLLTTPYIGLNNDLSSTREIDHTNMDCIKEDYCLGLVTISIPPNADGKNIVRVQLTDTPIRTVGNSISILSLILLTGITLILFKRNRKII